MAKKTKIKTKTPPKKKEAKSNSKQGVWGFGRGGPNAWNASENSLFKEGIKLHGWGAWNKIEAHIPTRSKIQIKSHAQKFKVHHGDEVERLIEEHKKYGSPPKRAADSSSSAASGKHKSSKPKKKVQQKQAKKKSQKTKESIDIDNKGTITPKSPQRKSIRSNNALTIQRKRAAAAVATLHPPQQKQKHSPPQQQQQQQQHPHTHSPQQQQQEQHSKQEQSTFTGFAAYRYRRLTCSIDGCTNKAQQEGICLKHGGKRVRHLNTCSIIWCSNKAQHNGKCISHGGKIIKKCSRPERDSQASRGKHARKEGTCIRHLQSAQCSIPWCPNKAQTGGICITHGVKKIEKMRSYPGCAEQAQAKRGGQCISHNMQSVEDNAYNAIKSALVQPPSLKNQEEEEESVSTMDKSISHGGNAAANYATLLSPSPGHKSKYEEIDRLASSVFQAAVAKAPVGGGMDDTENDIKSVATIATRSVTTAGATMRRQVNALIQSPVVIGHAGNLQCYTTAAAAVPTDSSNNGANTAAQEHESQQQRKQEEEMQEEDEDLDQLASDVFHAVVAQPRQLSHAIVAQIRQQQQPQPRKTQQQLLEDELEKLASNSFQMACAHMSADPAVASFPEKVRNMYFKSFS